MTVKYNKVLQLLLYGISLHSYCTDILIIKAMSLVFQMYDTDSIHWGHTILACNSFLFLSVNSLITWCSVSRFSSFPKQSLLCEREHRSLNQQELVLVDDLPNNSACHNCTMPTHSSSSWPGYRHHFQIRLLQETCQICFSVSEEWAQYEWIFTHLILGNSCCSMLMDFKSHLEPASHVSTS